jgi:prevent-host-death family protein
MQKIIGVTELQRNFRAVFDEVARDNMPYVLTRGSRPEAAIIPYEEFIRFLAWKDQEILAEFDRAMVRVAEQNAIYGDDEIAADVEAAIAEVRATPARRS